MPGTGNTLDTSQHRIPSGSPFTAGSANNGLSVDPISGKIVLGQDLAAVGNPAALLDPRNIPMNVGSSLQMTDAPLGGQVFVIDPFNHLYSIGDVGGSFDGSSFQIDDANHKAQINLLLHPGLLLDVGPIAGSDTFKFGDIDGVFGNGLELVIFDFSSEVFFDNVILAERYMGIRPLVSQFFFGNFDNAKDFTAHNPGGVGGGIGYQVVLHNGLPVFVIGDALNPQTLLLSPTGNVWALSMDEGGALCSLTDVASGANGLFINRSAGGGGGGAVFITGDAGGANVVQFQCNGSGAGRAAIVAPQGLFLNGDGFLIHALTTAFTNNAGAAVGTLNNSPLAGNPTKWIKINDNGTIRSIPCW